MTELGPPWAEIVPAIKARIEPGRQKQLARDDDGTPHDAGTIDVPKDE